MTVELIELAKTGRFSSFFLDYISGEKQLHKFYKNKPSVSGFAQGLKDRQFSSEKRIILSNVIKEQYNRLDKSDQVLSNIELLKQPNTYTVTTGHQLNIFTGPLYFIYKIVTTINLAKQLTKEFPEQNFVPVYWMATEDHDFEEINYVNIGGNKVVWNTHQTGAVGRFATDSIKPLLDTISGPSDVFKKAYTKHKTLADACRCYVNDMFGSDGLLVIDGDNANLKELLKEVIYDDLIKNNPAKAVRSTDLAIEKEGYKTQVHARDINFFYLKDNLRERIEKNNDKYVVLNTNIEFNQNELEKEIEEHPERFSPNVIVRPLYQELILPNLGYIGGPAEVIYWLQLKGVFDHFKADFPVLMPRNFGMVLPPAAFRKAEQLGVSTHSLFAEVDAQKANFVKTNSHSETDLASEKESLQSTYTLLAKKSVAVDKSLEKMVKAEAKKLNNAIEKIEKKILRAEKKKFSVEMDKLEYIHKALFPSNTMQERSANILDFEDASGSFLEMIKKSFDPFDIKFHVLKG